MSKRIIKKEIIEKILDGILSNPKLVYNEASLQFELAYRLRELECTVYVEKSIRAEDVSNDKIKKMTKSDVVKLFKKERMDICVINGDSSKTAIEVKYPPQNCNCKKRCEDFLKDIEFMENIKRELGFKKCFCLTLVSVESLKEKFSEIAKRKKVSIQWEHSKSNSAIHYYLLEV